MMESTPSSNASYPLAGGLPESIPRLEEGSMIPRDSSAWKTWYPSWDAWKFQRTLTYWISVMYLEGSILFLIGAAWSLTDLSHNHHEAEAALVQTSYLAGGVCFTVGSYAGLVEVLNLKEDGTRVLLWPAGEKWKRLRAEGSINWKALFGYSSYLFGAILYNVNTVSGYFELTPFEDTMLVGLTSLFGAVAFTAGAVLECLTNKIWEMNLSDGAWWVSVANLIGSLGYTLAGFSMTVKVEGTHNVDWLVNVPYLIGSAGFMIGGIATMWLWKSEQYGLGFLPEMNTLSPRQEPKEDEFVLSMASEYGCGRASPYQIPFLTMYLFNAAGSMLLVGISVFLTKDDFGFELYESILNFLLSHGVMLLGSVVHHVPTARPHNWLLVYMRIVLAMYTMNTWLSVFRHIGNFHDYSLYSSLF